jgi:hypothetical protein
MRSITNLRSTFGRCYCLKEICCICVWLTVKVIISIINKMKRMLRMTELHPYVPIVHIEELFKRRYGEPRNYRTRKAKHIVCITDHCPGCFFKNWRPGVKVAIHSRHKQTGLNKVCSHSCDS